MKIFCFYPTISALILLQACNTNKILVSAKDRKGTPYTGLYNFKSVELRDSVQDDSLSLIMTISGGGSRSSNFGKGVLLELESIAYNKRSNVLREIDYFSTASGGGHAAAAYVASIFEYKNNKTNTAPYSFNTFYQNQYRDLEFRYKTEPQVFYTLWMRFPYNRGNALEKRLDNSLLLRKKTGKSITLTDMFVPRNSKELVKLPMLIANGSCLENKLKVPFTPDVLKSYKLTAYTHRNHWTIDTAMQRVPLALALTASGTVPLMVPPTVFKVSHNKYLRFVDGGLTDNTGVATAVQILDQADRGNRKKLIVVDDTPNGIDNTYAKKRKKDKYNVGSLIWYGLDSKYTTFYDDIQKYITNRPQITGSVTYQCVVLDFLTLLRAPESDAMHGTTKLQTSDTTYLRAETTKYLLEKYENKPDVVPTPNDCKALFVLISHIDTKYEATDSERRILILAGRVVVRLQKQRLLGLLE